MVTLGIILLLLALWKKSWNVTPEKWIYINNLADMCFIFTVIAINSSSSNIIFKRFWVIEMDN